MLLLRVDGINNNIMSPFIKSNPIDIQRIIAQNYAAEMAKQVDKELMLDVMEKPEIFHLRTE